MLAAALAGCAFLAGITGAWSPCGFSVVETLWAGQGRRASVAAAGSFAVGALVGAAATFMGLAALGGLVPMPAAVATAATVALAAAVAEAAGVRIVPQVRRQVPERWRRAFPLPLAAAAYGALLGLGFLTFVLTLAFWALAGIALALGSLRFGVALALGFGVGRALPIAVLAAFGDSRRGREILDVMATRPRLLRGLRAVDAAALALCAAVLLAAGASAASVANGSADPSAEQGLVAWDGPGGGKLRYDIAALGGAADAHHAGPLLAPLPGRDPAIGGGLVAWRQGDAVRVVRWTDFHVLADVSIPGVDALAVSPRWLAYRWASAAGDRIGVRSLRPGGSQLTIASAHGSTLLGRPALDGDRLGFHVASPVASRIVVVDLRTGRRRTVRRSSLAQLTNPSLSRGLLLYVRASSLAQRLELGPLTDPSSDRVLFRRGPVAAHDAGHEPGYSHATRTPVPHRFPSVFWTTALAPRSAYLTLFSPRTGLGGSRIVGIRLAGPTVQRPSAAAIEAVPFPQRPVLAYTASEPTGDELLLVTATGEQHAVAHAIRLQDPAWSRDGASLAFAGPHGLVVLSRDGRMRTITGSADDSDPSWSPDGSKLAFTRRGRLYTVAAGGGPVRRLSAGPRDQEPAWSPNGTTVAFARKRRGNWDLYTTDLGGHVRRLTATKAAEGSPSWSADGRALAFDRRTRAGLRVFVIGSTGGVAKQLSAGPGDDFHPAWSADGAAIAFVGDGSGRPRIYRTPAAGGPAGVIGDAAGLDDAPAWAPRDSFSAP